MVQCTKRSALKRACWCCEVLVIPPTPPNPTLSRSTVGRQWTGIVQVQRSRMASGVALSRAMEIHRWRSTPSTVRSRGALRSVEAWGCAERRGHAAPGIGTAHDCRRGSFASRGVSVGCSLAVRVACSAVSWPEAGARQLRATSLGAPPPRPGGWSGRWPSRTIARGPRVPGCHRICLQGFLQRSQATRVRRADDGRFCQARIAVKRAFRSLR